MGGRGEEEGRSRKGCSRSKGGKSAGEYSFDKFQPPGKRGSKYHASSSRRVFQPARSRASQYRTAGTSAVGFNVPERDAVRPELAEGGERETSATPLPAIPGIQGSALHRVKKLRVRGLRERAARDGSYATTSDARNPARPQTRHLLRQKVRLL